MGRNIAVLMDGSLDLGSQPALAKKTGVAQSTIGRILRSEVNASGENLRKIADAYRVSVASLFLDQDAFLRVIEGGANPHDSSRSQAHSMSHPPYQNVPTKIEWGAKRVGELPTEFGVHLPDDSMAPEAKAGALVWFERGLEPRPGDWVLVIDRANNWFMREYRQRRPGDWYAFALNSAFDTLEPSRDGIEVAAIFMGMKARRG